MDPDRLPELPAFPAVEIDGEVVFERQAVTEAALEAAVRKRLPHPSNPPGGRP
ncbi:hypothetical protein G3N55_10205 [Dissulfurirhabdus thermomarina]|uniref:Uncharacterized protein n=1 Tax=Dissulfurirhabdus thermomarina TaxID=1765737 RepID=A0A6N9TPK7_DISTH|nr:hypothetical protein [Dissulfurirhabdus thermomarina]NDY43211.1 hypothetical protein [Dissulfurirhabdus thermomarina]NMX23929.1 hypothetical protein [Dissulfurirhabdus thermomarina]